MFSCLDLIFEEPRFDNIGHSIPDKYGHINSELNGNVRIALSHHYGKKIPKDLWHFHSYSAVFDNKGQLRHREKNDIEGNLVEIDNYIYNEDGRCSDYYAVDNTGKLKEHYIFNYDQKGRLSSYEIYSSNNDYFGKRVNIYDNNDFLIEEHWHSATHSNSWYMLYKNNEHGNWTELIEYRGNFDDPGYYLSKKLIKKYDSNGHVIEFAEVKSDGTLRKIPTDLFDKKGRCVKLVDWDLDIKYDSHNKINEIVDPEGKTNYKVFYNHDGSITILKLDKPNSTAILKIDISFDNHKNIKSIIKYSGNNLEEVKVITYSYDYYSS